MRFFSKTSATIAWLIVATLSAAFVVFAVASVGLRPPPPFDVVAGHDAWKTEVAQRMATLTVSSSASDIRAVREALVLVRVSADDRDAHLALILSLSAFERGEPGAYDHVQQAVSAIEK